MTNNEIEKILEEYKEKFWNDEADLRGWMLKQSTQRPEQEEWLKEKLLSLHNSTLDKVEEMIAEMRETNKYAISADYEGGAMEVFEDVKNKLKELR